MKKVAMLATLCVLAALRAQAAPITVSAGEFVIFNFDLTGETPPPPYASVGLDVQLDDLEFEPPPCSGADGACEPLDKGEWKLWTEVGGAGLNFFTFPAVNLNAVWNLSEMNDGVFSATLRITEGSVTVDPIVCGKTPDGTGTPACPQVSPPPVPEPSVLSLLASAAVARRYRRRREGAA